MRSFKHIKAAALIVLCSAVLTTSNICAERAAAAPAVASSGQTAVVQDTAIEVKPLSVVSSPKAYLNKTINEMLKFFTALGIGIIACMPIVYPIMIDNSYWEGYNQVPIMIVGSIFNIVVGLISTIYVAKKNTKAIASTSIVSAIVNIIVNLILINFIDLYAATIASLVAYASMSVYRLYDIKKKYFEIKISKKFILVTIIILIPILLIYYSNNIILYFIGILIAIIYALMINRKSLKSIVNMILKKN